MGQFENLFRSKFTAAELADKLYVTMIAAGVDRDSAMNAADLAEYRGRAAAVRALEEFAAAKPTRVQEPVVMIGWYDN